MTRTIVVTGATGKQGGSVVNTFLTLPGWKVRGLTRNASSQAAKSLSSRGVEVVQADLTDVSSLIAAFQGANVIFLVTDFWAAVSNPENYARAAEQGINVCDFAFDVEVAHGINAATAASNESVLPGLERFIFSSLADMRTWTNGAMSSKNHFESKGKIETHLLSLPSLGEKLSTVQLGFYYANWKSSPIYAPTKIGGKQFVHRTPFALTTKMPWVDPERDTGKFVKALVEAPQGTHMLGVSQFGTFGDVMDAFARFNGVEAVAEHVPAANFFANAAIPEDIKPVLIQLTSFMDGYGWTGGDPRIMLPLDIDPDLKTVSIESYVRSEDWSSIL